MTMNERPNSASEGPVPHQDLGGFLLGGLTADEHARFEADLARDPKLQREVDELADLPRLLGLAALVDDEHSDVAVPPQRVVPLVQRPAKPARRLGPLVAAAAAAVMLMVGFGAGVLANRTSSPSADREVAFGIVAGSPFPEAKGTALLFRQPDGVGVRLKMTGLAPSLPGSRYECWWVGKNGRVAAGSFQVGPNGQTDVRLNVAGSLDGPFKININSVSGTTETKVLTAEVT
jgi:Anti-sigma-K factor rskA